MKTTILTMWVTCILALLLSGGAALAQEEPERVEKVIPGDKTAELIDRIKKGLEAIDENLLNTDAQGVRETMKENVKNIEELLKDTRGKSSQVISDLNELIQSIKYKQ